MGEGGLVSELMWGIVLKSKWKLKRDLEKPGTKTLNSLSLMFGIYQMVL